jgi:hypothetical protein
MANQIHVVTLARIKGIIRWQLARMTSTKGRLTMRFLAGIGDFPTLPDSTYPVCRC